MDQNLELICNEIDYQLDRGEFNTTEDILEKFRLEKSQQYEKYEEFADRYLDLTEDYRSKRSDLQIIEDDDGWFGDLFGPLIKPVASGAIGGAILGEWMDKPHVEYFVIGGALLGVGDLIYSRWKEHKIEVLTPAQIDAQLRQITQKYEEQKNYLISSTEVVLERNAVIAVAPSYRS